MDVTRLSEGVEMAALGTLKDKGILKIATMRTETSFGLTLQILEKVFPLKFNRESKPGATRFSIRLPLSVVSSSSSNLEVSYET
jgi:hypothetical protein